MVGTNMATAPREITAIRASLWRKSICSPNPYLASWNSKMGYGTGFARMISCYYYYYYYRRHYYHYYHHYYHHHYFCC